MVKLALSSQVTGRRQLGSLPAEATGFVGRTSEMSAITTLLTCARLVTVTGSAGVGKTRACLRLAAQSAGQFPDGTWLVELSDLHDTALHDTALHGTVRDTDFHDTLRDTDLRDTDLRGTDLRGTGRRDIVLLFDAVAAALGLPGASDDGSDSDDGGGGSRQAAVLSHLRDRRLLLILDTCEHVLDACATFAEIVLSQAQAVTLLTTSRQPLNAPGEHVFRMPPLRIDDEATELFAQRAAAVMPEFEVTPGNQADVARLCRRLDGIPLAIELAAFRLRALPLPDLADRLQAGFGLLAASRRGTTERHQTLRAAVAWSHDLCTPAEQSLWKRLSVFRGSFSVAAAEDVCADAALPRAEILGALAGLVDKSVVLRCDGNESSFRLLDAVREFGAEQLAAGPGPGCGSGPESGDDQARVLDRLAARCLSMATHFDQNFLDDDQVNRYRELRREHDSITAALEHTLGTARLPAPDGDLLARARQGAALTIRLQEYWQMSGLIAEGRGWLGKVLRLFGPRSAEHAWALGVSGRLATFQGDLDTALAEIRQSIRLAGDLGEPLAEALGYFYLNLALALAGSHAQALAAGETARRTMTACDHRLGLIALEGQMGHLHQLAGDVGLAIESCERGLALLGPSPGERWITGYLNLVFGFALFQRPGSSRECALAIRRALSATHEIGDAVGIAYALEVLGWLAARDERFDDAALLLGAADPLWRQTAGRLSNTALMEQTHQQVAGRASGTLGERRYAAAYAKGAALPLDDVVRQALDMSSPTVFAGSGAAGPAGSAGRRRAAGPPAAVSAGLTRREKEIAALVASGLSNREIADALFISKRTVDAHVEHIFGKLEISSRVQLTVWLRSNERAPVTPVP